MGGAHSHAGVTAFTLCLLLSLSMAAPADISLTYSGETPVGSGDGNEGIDGLSSGDDTLWDYVYTLNGYSGAPSDPTAWAIYVPYGVETIQSPSGWSGGWDSEITSGEYAFTADFDALIGRAAVVWEVESPGAGSSGFGFQSRTAPSVVVWETAGSSFNSGSGYEYSAAPEPCTLALTSLGLLAIGAWRRRRSSL